ncbi:MAG: nuclear transport factor 2 family protein [Porticoccaceae bacterium]
MNDQEEVLFCNDAFYQAFLNKDFPAMEQVWAARAPLLCIHPGGHPLIQREDVLASWRQIFEHESAQAIAHANHEVIIYPGITLVTCYEWDERRSANRLLATNGFVKEDDRYRIVMHQAGLTSGPAPEQQNKPTLHAVH